MRDQTNHQDDTNHENSHAINHPVHYNSHPSGIECIDVAEHMGFCLGNAVKYLWRSGLKTDNATSVEASAIEDLKKARWYIDREISRLEREAERKEATS